MIQPFTYKETDLSRTLEKIQSGERLDFADGAALFTSGNPFPLGREAARAAARLHGDRVYYARNRHINPTNICVNRCGFCAFSRSKGDQGSYELTVEEALDRLACTTLPGEDPPFTEVHIVGGLHPDFSLAYYLKLVSSIKERFSGVSVKAFTAVEVDHFSRISGLSLADTLRALKDHGLDTMPGGGAEIFSPQVRNRLCPEKISGARWLEVHEAAHQAGIKTNATMLYGHIESFEERVDHLLQLRKLQDRTGGFLAFIPLSYQPGNNVAAARAPSGIDDLVTIAASRLMLDNIPHIKAYWVMLGEKIAQTALLFGANDVDGTVMEERIAHAAGADSEGSLTVEKLRYLIEKAGKHPVERDSLYRPKEKIREAETIG